jgi:hypothetical protein
MKQGVFSLSILTVFLVFACHESSHREIQKQELVLNRSIGERISADLANQWIANYEKSASSGRFQEAELIVTKDQLTGLLAQFPALGLAFHYATDEQGQDHLVVLALDEGRKFWSGTNDRRYVDVTNDTFIDETTARNWTRRFRDANPNSVWFHFFGLDVFSEMNSVAWFSRFEIVPALNDNSVVQLLLVLRDERGITGGRVLDTEIIVWDKGGTCPPCDDEDPSN